jgi:crossover junction endodeoxyribonuclease RuvC
MTIKLSGSKPLTALGIDASVSGTGLVLLQENGQHHPKVAYEGEVAFSGLRGCHRLKEIVAAIMGTVHGLKPDKIVMEGYSLNLKNRASVVPLVELGGLLRFMLYLDGLPWFEPRASELKKFATGSGNSPKDKVMMHVLKRWGHESKTNNTADAFVLAAMGLAQANRLPGITLDMRKITGAMSQRCD